MALKQRETTRWIARVGTWIKAVIFFVWDVLKSFLNFKEEDELLWVFDFIVAGSFILVYEKTGEDLSLGSDYRRAIDTIHKKSRIVGYIALAIVIIKAIFWDGPEQVIIFFRKEIRTVPRIIVVLLILTVIQALIWAALYGLGYDLVAG
ncbi:MAG: hypothetical protein NTY93_01820 [Candidatus Kaiserbacteria bacterium]|nr:hypothetical protein [Candidatus Kaiserbacteria bacterium]